MRAGVEVESLGIRFLFDAQRRPVTPGVASIRRRCTSSWGLQGVDLSIGPGEAVALVGPNGAGKTTLLRALAGVYEPDDGCVTVTGRIGSLLAVGAGLMPLLTGRENCLLQGVLAGLSRVQSRAALDEVKRRSELGDAFERLVSSYSQGMRARLGFAAIELSRPEILLLDEVHQAFDIDFRKRVEERAAAIVAGGGRSGSRSDKSERTDPSLTYSRLTLGTVRAGCGQGSLQRGVRRGCRPGPDREERLDAGMLRFAGLVYRVPAPRPTKERVCLANDSIGKFSAGSPKIGASWSRSSRPGSPSRCRWSRRGT